MASTDTGLQADPEPQTDTEEVQTPGTDAHIMSVINRPEFRNIVRWTDDMLLLFLAELRRQFQVAKIDVRKIFDIAAKIAVAPTCTGDAVVQQIVKREKRIKEKNPEANGSAIAKSATERTQMPTTPKAAKTAGNKASRSGSKPAATKPVKASLTTPVATPSRKKAIFKASSRPTASAGAVSTPKSVKAEPKKLTPIAPITTSGIDEDSDSEYTESPGKQKKKRARSTVKKPAQKYGSKKAKRYLSDSESDSEYFMVDTPSKKAASKSTQPNTVKKNSPIMGAIKTSSARKSLPAAVEEVQSVEIFEEQESEDDNEDESYVVVKKPQSPLHDFSDPAVMLLNMSGTAPHSHTSYEGPSRHDSRYNSPPISNGYIDNSLGCHHFTQGQPLSDGTFGGPLHGGNQSSSYEDRFDLSSFGMSNSGLNRMVPSSYANFQSMPRTSNHGSYVPGNFDSFGAHIRGDLPNGNNVGPAPIHQDRHFSFSTATSEETLNFPDFLAEQERGSFFAAAGEDSGDHDDYNLLNTNFKFDGI